MASKMASYDLESPSPRPLNALKRRRATPLHADRLFKGDPHVGHVVAMEEMAQLPVREAQRQEVQHLLRLTS